MASPTNSVDFRIGVAGGSALDTSNPEKNRNLREQLRKTIQDLQQMQEALEALELHLTLDNPDIEQTEQQIEAARKAKAFAFDMFLKGSERRERGESERSNSASSPCFASLKGYSLPSYEEIKRRMQPSFSEEKELEIEEVNFSKIMRELSKKVPNMELVNGLVMSKNFNQQQYIQMVQKYPLVIQSLPPGCKDDIDIIAYAMYLEDERIKSLNGGQESVYLQNNVASIFQYANSKYLEEPGVVAQFYKTFGDSVLKFVPKSTFVKVMDSLKKV